MEHNHAHEAHNEVDASLAATDEAESAAPSAKKAGQRPPNLFHVLLSKDGKLFTKFTCVSKKEMNEELGKREFDEVEIIRGFSKRLVAKKTFKFAKA